jgi:hypothetical protein
MTPAPAHNAQSSTVYVNTQPHTVSGKELSFEQIAALAYGGTAPTGPGVVVTITYRKGDDAKQQGSLVAGDSVKVKDGMVFNVSATDKS